MAGPATATGPEKDLDSPRLQVGDVLLGRFYVSRFIAQGGMGAVYEASDSLLKTRVALKVIRGISTDAGALERFRREVLLARRVSHPNVCRVYELYEGTTSTGAPVRFLTMELLEGESLAQRLARQGRLTTAEAAPLVRQMCEGLAAAHAEGVIHRDFKSSNVMLVPPTATPGGAATDSKRVVITDFGVARAVHLATEEAEEEPLTGRAGILGTPEYMAPEQVTGGEVTAASDIYALGVVLYEMVTGKLPFVGDTPLASAARRLDEVPPRPDESVPGLDRRWVESILRCLARQPERRFKSARDVIAVLERHSGHRRRLQALALTAALLALLGAFVVVRYSPSLRLREPRRSAVVAAPRPLVAVLGFRNELPSPKLRWLPTAVTELVAHELAAAEGSLRVYDTSDLDYRGLRSLGVTADSVGDQKNQSRLAAVLGADVLVHGVLTPWEPGSDAVRLRLEALDAETRKPRASFDVDLGPGAAQLQEKLTEAGARLRSDLGAGLSLEEEAALSSSRARNLDAVRAYAEGVERLHDFEFGEARSHFEAALVASPNFLDPQRRIAESWNTQGDRKRERETWQRIRARPDGLTARGIAEVDANLLGLGPDAQKAKDAWMALFEATPDDTELAFVMLENRLLPGRAWLEMTKRLRQVHGPHLILDALEAVELDGTGDTAHAQEQLTRVLARARELGARYQIGFALHQQGDIASRHGRLADALESYREAEGAFAAAGLLESLANVKYQSAFLDVPPREALAALDEAAGVYRRLGNRRRLEALFSTSVLLWVIVGDIQVAGKRLEEARSEAELLGEAPLPGYFAAQALLLSQEGDLNGCRKAIQEWRGRASKSDAALGFEASILYEQDHLEEARVSFIRMGGVEGGSAACRVVCEQGRPSEGLACLAAVPGLADMGRGDAADHGIIEAKCRYLSGDFSGAEKAARRVLSDAPPGDFWIRVRSTIELERAVAARGQATDAISRLKANLAELETRRYVWLAFEAALALGDVELRAGRPEGRTRLVRLEHEATSKEYFRIARLAREALDQHPASPAARLPR